MKKIFLSILLFCLLSTIFIPVLTKAGDDPACMANGNYGIVRCGCGTPVMSNGVCTNCCDILDIFATLARIYDFIVKMIATPLAIIALTIGAIFMMVSAGNPNLMGTGKKILYAAIIGLALVWCSWLIIDFILKALGYVWAGSWFAL